MVQFHGVGRGPEGSEKYGSVSQLALFIRKDILNLPCEIESRSETDEEELKTYDDKYNLIHSQDYPFFCDTRDRGQKVIDEAEYHLRRLKYGDEDFYVLEKQKYCIPLTQLAACTYQITESVEELR